jgi:Uma2 family endonuclease
MTTATATELEELAPGTILQEVSWKVYRALRAREINDHTRMTYLDGTLILMSPQWIHERGERYLDFLVPHVALASGIPCDTAGGTTLWLEDGRKRKRKGLGKEPDGSFYFGDNVERMMDRDDIDLQVDPPPDLAIEIDNKADSELALPIYARLGVPEVWRYHARRGTLWFGRLADGAYESIDRSLGLPILTPALVLEVLAHRKAARMSLTQWMTFLPGWVQGLPPVPAP